MAEGTLFQTKSKWGNPLCLLDFLSLKVEKRVTTGSVYSSLVTRLERYLQYRYVTEITLTTDELTK